MILSPNRLCRYSRNFSTQYLNTICSWCRERSAEWGRSSRGTCESRAPKRKAVKLVVRVQSINPWGDMGGSERPTLLVSVLLVAMFTSLCSRGAATIEEGTRFLIRPFLHNNTGVCNYGCSVKLMKYCFGYATSSVNIVYCWTDPMLSYEILGAKKQLPLIPPLSARITNFSKC